MNITRYMYICHGIILAVILNLSMAYAKPFKIAIMPFYEQSFNRHLDAQNTSMHKVMVHNLTRSGDFIHIPKTAYTQSTLQNLETPDFAYWNALGTQVLTTVSVEHQDNVYTYIMNVWHISKQIIVVRKKYTVQGVSLMERLPYIMADDIYTRLTRKGAYFDSQILYVAPAKDMKNGMGQRLAIMSPDGMHIKYLTMGEHMVISPRFSPDGRYIIYASYKDNTGGIYVRDTHTGRRTFIATQRTTSYTPRFAPDNKKIIFSNIVDGRSDIWVMYLKRDQGKIKFDRLTDTTYMDMSPYYAPQGDKIVFMSDRTGSPQLYTMRSNGTDVQRLSKGKGAYTNPVWSPSGDKIAFTKQVGDTFHIGIMNTDGSGERILSTGYLDEDPTFSPNGQFIVFSRQTPDRQTYLMQVRIDGVGLMRFQSPVSASQPNWSTLRGL